MAGYELDINGKVSLAPISVNRVNKYYTSQNEFLREPAVLTSRSKKGEVLYLITVPFDAQDEDDMEKMIKTVSMFRSFPYIFIAGQVMEDAGASLGDMTIGDGYFMYALHEYEIEVTADNQGLYLLSFRVQPINWRSLCKKMAFWSLDDTSVYADGKKQKTISLANNPGESNILDIMINYFISSANVNQSDLKISSKTEGQKITIGIPVVGDSISYKSVPNQLGSARVFRITPPVDTSNLTSNDTDTASSKGRSNVSEISQSAPEIDTNESRVYVAYRGIDIGPGDESTISSIVVRRRNRFANQTIADWVLPYAQYLGKTPSEVLISAQTLHDDIINAAMPSRIVDSINTFSDQIRSSYPFMMGIDAFRIGNPLINLMGVNYVILDSSQMSIDAQANNITLNNYTFLESDQSSLLERSKYVLSSESASGSNSEKLSAILQAADIVNKDPKSSDPNIQKVKSDIMNMMTYIKEQVAIDDERTQAAYDKAKKDAAKFGQSLNLTTDQFIQKYKASSDNSNRLLGTRVLGNVVSTDAYKKSDDYGKVLIVLKYLQSSVFSKKDNMSSSEVQKLSESSRILLAGINETYQTVLTSAPHNPVIQEILIRELKKEQERLKNSQSNTIMTGEAAPDLMLGEIFKGITNVYGFEEGFNYISTLPFIYDVAHLDPVKIEALWEKEKPKIDEEMKRMSGYLVGVYGKEPTESEFPIYNGENKGKLSEFNTLIDQANASSGLSVDGSSQSNALAGASNSGTYSGGWGGYGSVTNGGSISAEMGTIRDYKSGRRGHEGMDIAVPVGTNVYAIGQGTISKSTGGDYGNMITINHGNGIFSRYAHLSQFIASGNVAQGTLIAKSGGAAGAPGAGSSRGPHVHLETLYGSTKMDPKIFNPKDRNTWYTTGINGSLPLKTKYTYKYRG